MKKVIQVLFIFLTNFTISMGQDPDIIWQRSIGGSDIDYLNTAIKTNDNGFLIGGGSSSNISGEKTENSRGGFDIWIVKLNNFGNIEWQRTIGGNRSDGVTAIIQTNDGGYLLGAQSSSDISGEKTENSRGIIDYWVVKIDSLGNIEWQKTIGGSLDDQLYGLGQATDGNYFIGGHSESPISGEKTENSMLDDYWVLKLDTSGNIIWQNTIGGNYDDRLWALYPTNDGGCILAGDSISNISGDKTEDAYDSYGDFWIVKLDVSGNIEWENTIGGTKGDSPNDIIQTFDGNFIVAGASISDISGDKTENSMGFADYWILKLDFNGNILWQNTIGGNDSDYLKSIKQLTNGNYLLGGTSFSDISGDKIEDNKGLYDYWVMCITEGGNILTQNTIGGDRMDVLDTVLITDSNTIFMAGESSSDISGDKTENSRGADDFWVLELDNILSFKEFDTSFALKLYPNPVRNSFQINSSDINFSNLKIYSIQGQLIFESNDIDNNSSIDISTLSSGLYYLQLTSEKSTSKIRIIKE